jgi:hypothetical protein
MKYSIRLSFWVLVLAFAFASPCSAQSTPADPEQQVTKTVVYVLGPTWIEQKKISSVQGPSLQQEISLGKDPAASTVWLKSLKIETLDDHGPVKTSEFICHAWLEIKDRDLNYKRPLYMTQGLGRQVNLPSGYGMRVDNLRSFSLLRVQALNSDAAPAFNARYRMTVKYIEDEDAQKFGLKNLRSVFMSIWNKDAAAKNQKIALQSNSKDSQADDHQCTAGTPNSDSFMVPPGHHVYFKVYNDRNHSIYNGGRVILFNKHMHRFGESVDLIDQTTGKVVLPAFVPNARNLAVTGKLDTISYIDKGLSIDPTHTYALKAVYNNSTNEPVMGMALIELYISDEK